MSVIGLISDTHGLLRPEAVEALAGVDLIIHAGDIGQEQVVESLGAIAPVRAIRGNVDRGAWAGRFPDTDIVEVADTRIYVIHNRADIALAPAAAGFAVVVSGHSHKPRIERAAGVLFVNPGSAGPRRFSLPVTLGMLDIDSGLPQARIVKLFD